MIRVTWRGGKSRTVRVLEVEGRRAYTTSGKVRGGHFRGGNLEVRGGDLLFQPTLQTQIVRVMGLERLGVAQ